MQTMRVEEFEALVPTGAQHATHNTLQLEPVNGLFVIYDADGTPAGELIYMTKKLLGLGHCAACDITHGPRKEKPEFTQLKTAGWSVPLTNIHRDEMDAALAAAVGARLPCVAARTATRDVVLVGQDTLATCEGDVVRFQQLVNFALRVHGLSAAPACAPRFAAPVPPKAPSAALPKWHWAEWSGDVMSRVEEDAVVPGSYF